MLTLKQVVLDLKRTQKDLASELGCTPVMMNNYINGKTRVPVRLLDQFCNILGISIKAFKLGEVKKARGKKKATTNVIKAKAGTTKVIKKTAKKAAKKTVVKAAKTAKKTTKKSKKSA